MKSFLVTARGLCGRSQAALCPAIVGWILQVLILAAHFHTTHENYSEFTIIARGFIIIITALRLLRLISDYYRTRLRNINRTDVLARNFFYFLGASYRPVNYGPTLNLFSPIERVAFC